jgi:hypothetical protein
LTDLHFEVFLRPHTACAGTPVADREPCVLRLDDTLDRDGTFRIR